MKFRLIERNFWGEIDTWVGRKNKYKVEIDTPYRPNHQNFGKYSFSIKTLYSTIHNTIKSGIYFDSLNECFEYVEKWIIDDCKESQ